MFVSSNRDFHGACMSGLNELEWTLGRGYKSSRMGVRMFTVSSLSRSSSTGTLRIDRVSDIIAYIINQTSIASIKSATAHCIPPTNRAAHRSSQRNHTVYHQPNEHHIPIHPPPWPCRITFTVTHLPTLHQPGLSLQVISPGLRPRPIMSCGPK